MAFKQIFAPIMQGAPVRVIANWHDMVKMRNILNDIQGVNCRIAKPDHNQGLGWRIIVDGTSDEEPDPNTSVPWNYAANQDYSFRVTHNSGDEYSISEGNFYGFNQSINVAGDATFAAGAGVKYLRLKVTLTASTFAIASAAIEAKANESDANTTLIYWYTIAEVNAGVTLQRVMGDIYDRNLPTKDEEHDVAVHTSNGYPYSSSVLAKGP